MIPTSNKVRKSLYKGTNGNQFKMEKFLSLLWTCYGMIRTLDVRIHLQDFIHEHGHKQGGGGWGSSG